MSSTQHFSSYLHSVLTQEDEAACATMTAAITEKWMTEVARRKAEADKEKGMYSIAPYFIHVFRPSDEKFIVVEKCLIIKHCTICFLIVGVQWRIQDFIRGVLLLDRMQSAREIFTSHTHFN